MEKTLSELAELVQGEIIGNRDLVITGLNGIQEAGEGELTFISNPKYNHLVETSQASAILTSRDNHLEGKTVIKTDNPSLAFSLIAELYSTLNLEPSFKGIHSSVVLGENVQILDGVNIGPYTIVENDVVIGSQTTIYGGCYLGKGSQVGENNLIHPGVMIGYRCQIGSRVIIHSGTVIGSDGFGFEPVDGVYKKIPQLGIVVVEDEVEIGANVTIDRARFDKTVIGKGTKIDNLVQIAHNVVTGENCILIAQSGIAGSVKLGKNVIIAGQSGVAGHLTVGDGSVVASKSGVVKSVLPYTKVFGTPAQPHLLAKRMNIALQHLPEYLVRIRELESRIEELEKRNL